MRTARSSRSVSADRGQASVELVALLPLTLIIGLAIMAVLAARAASGDASAAAQAGAMALIQDGEPHEAAEAALSGDVRKRATIDVRGRKVTVTVRPPAALPLLGDAFAATATAHAGPASP
jgi:hypothetical protein